MLGNVILQNIQFNVILSIFLLHMSFFFVFVQ